MLPPHALYFPLPPPARGEGVRGGVRGADGPIHRGAHLTFPLLRDGPLPRPASGRRGALRDAPHIAKRGQVNATAR
jgi:hypothetical protein